MKAIILAAAAFVVFSGAALAQEQAEEPAKEEKKICRTERMTGSLTRRTRVCLTRAEWRELHGRTKKGLDDFVGAASGGCRAPADPRVGTMCGG